MGRVEWRKINKFPYKVSNHGNVKSLLRIVNNRRRSGKNLKNNIDSHGYCYVNFWVVGKVVPYKIHLLVLEYFGPPKPSPKHQCNHKDGNKENNHISNLEWVTPGENQKHAYALGLKIPNSKLTKKKVKWIRSLYRDGRYTQKELGGMFGVSRVNINHIVNNKYWKEI